MKLSDHQLLTKCRHCGGYVLRARGHWVQPTVDRSLDDLQDFSRARTCDRSPVIARLHAPTS